MTKDCSAKIKQQIRQSSADYWKAQCVAAGIDYKVGEAPQNTRKRIREAQDAALKFDNGLHKKNDPKPSFMDYFLGRVRHT